MTINVDSVGSVGLITDIKPADVPPNGWSAASNVRFEHGMLKTAFGYVVEDFTSAAEDILAMTFVQNGAASYLVYAADTTGSGVADSILSYDGTNESDITGSWVTAGATVDDTVTTCQLHGYTVINNGISSPMTWDGNSATVDELQYSPAETWSQYGATAKIVRAYRQFLVAMNVTDNGVTNERLLWTSSIAVPGNLPPSWDFSTPEEEAVRVELAETNGYIIDGLQLRDQFVVYKTDAIYLMNYVGSFYVQSFQPVSRSQGLMSANCVVEANQVHFCVGQRDIYVFDGQSTQSIAEGRVKAKFFAELDETRKYLVFMSHNLSDHEVWIHYPTLDSTGCEDAYVYKYEENIWSHRKTPTMYCSSLGNDFDQPIVNYDDETTLVYASETELTYRETSYAAVASQVYGGGAQVYKLDVGNTLNGAQQTWSVRLTDRMTDDTMRVNMWQEMRFTAKGAPFTVRVGRQDAPEGNVTWEYAGQWVPGQSRKINLRVTGNLHALELTGTEYSEVSRYAIETALVGRR